MTMVIIDTDILSMFAKADAVDLLFKLFRDRVVAKPEGLWQSQGRNKINCDHNLLYYWC